jgi:hypothetical protein
MKNTKNGVRTGKKPASTGGKLLNDDETSKKMKSLAGCVLVNRKKRT